MQVGEMSSLTRLGHLRPEALAGVAVAGSGLTRAAELAGVRDARRAQTGALVPPAHGKLAQLAPPDIIEAIMEGEARDE
jgi:hypothetical protein